jgi:hypothetical protein
MKEEGQKQGIRSKKGLYIEALGSRAVASKVSITSRARIVPLSLITYIEGILEKDVSFS